MKKKKKAPTASSAKHGFFHSKIAKIVASSIALLSLIVTGYGVYSLNKNNINPRDGWTENFAKANEQFRSLPAEYHTESENYSLNIEYGYDKTYGDSGHKLDFSYVNRYLLSLVAYEHDRSVKYNSISVAWRASEEDFLKDLEWLDNLKFRIAFAGKSTTFGTDISLMRGRITASIDCPVKINNDKLDVSQLDLDLKAVIINTKDYRINVFINKTLKPNGILYNLMYDALNLFYPIVKMCMSALCTIFNTLLDFPYVSFDDYVEDLQHVYNAQMTNTQVGNISLIAALPLFIIAISVLLLPLIFVGAKERKTVAANAVASSSSKIKAKPMKSKAGLIINKKVRTKLSSFNSITLSTFIIAALSISIIAANVALSYYLNPNIIVFDNVNTIQTIGKNLLIVGTMCLAFFGSIYIAKKDDQAFKQIIVATFFAAIFCYLFNVLACQYLSQYSNISYLITDSFLKTTMDNIFVPLFLGLAGYYFLFKTPKMHMSKMLAVLAGALLVVACFVDPISSGISIRSYYLTSLFSPNLIIANLFIIGYLIVSYVTSRINYKKHKKDMSYANYLASVNGIKNAKIVATIIIVALFAIDLVCRFYTQINILNFGYNHGIALLLPIIWLYKTDAKQKEIKINPLMLVIVTLVVLGSIAIFAQTVNGATSLLKEIR